MIANTATAVATASTIVQPKSPQPGPPNDGSGNGLNDHAAVLKPENDPSPMKTSEPTPAARRPGRSTSGSVAPPSPVASITSTAPITGDPKIDDTAAKLPAAAISPTACWGASRLTSRIAIVPSPRPTAIKRPFRSEHEPESERRQRRQQHPGQVDRSGRRATGLEPVGGHVTAVPGQTHDRKRRQQPRECHPRKRPPDRNGVVPDLARQILVDPHLQLVHPLQEAPRRRRDQQPDERRQHQQDAVLPAPHQGSGIGATRNHRSRARAA